MAGMDGIEALRRIKQIDPAVSVVMISVCDDPDRR